MVVLEEVVLEEVGEEEEVGIEGGTGDAVEAIL